MASSQPTSQRGSTSRPGIVQLPHRSSSAISFGEGIRRQSTQDRLEEILKNGRERADNMGTSNAGSNPATRMSQTSITGNGPNETTGIMTAHDQRSYQGTHTGTRHRRPTPASTQAQQDEDDHVSDEKGWLGDYLSGLWSIELENTGSTARDHLALERTFLAWLRTSLGFASIGIAVTQLFRLNTSLTNGEDDERFAEIRHIGKPLGATFIGISILVLLLGYLRYYQSQQWVLKGKFPASRGAIILVSLIAFLLMAASLTVVIVIQPTVRSA